MSDEKKCPDEICYHLPKHGNPLARKGSTLQSLMDEESKSGDVEAPSIGPLQTTTLPQTQEEYDYRFHHAYKVEGQLFDTTIHMPCPFCACPDWMIYKILDVESAMRKTHSCPDCYRSARAIFIVDTLEHTVWTLVQTGGDDPPPWAPFRRETEEESANRLAKEALVKCD